MPIYDYRCDHCGHVFHARQSFTDAPLRVCPNCGKEPRRVVAPPAIVFKGSGWYKTDSRAKAADAGPSNGKVQSDEKTGGTKTTETKKDAAASDKTSSSSG